MTREEFKYNSIPQERIIKIEDLIHRHFDSNWEDLQNFHDDVNRGHRTLSSYKKGDDFVCLVVNIKELR